VELPQAAAAHPGGTPGHGLGGGPGRHLRRGVPARAAADDGDRSNNTRELTEALKRRCLYLWLDYPGLEHELEIVRLHTPDLPEAVARKLVEVVAMVRDLDLKKPPSIAESIDWARALLLLGAQDIDNKTFTDTLSIIVKHRTDLDVVAERVGVKLGGGLGGAVGAPAGS
jgi:hypothetical protein